MNAPAVSMNDGSSATVRPENVPVRSSMLNVWSGEIYGTGIVYDPSTALSKEPAERLKFSGGTSTGPLHWFH